MTLTGYLTRMVLSLVVLGGAAYAAARLLPARFRMGAQGSLKLRGALNLGRDVVYLVQIGPDIVALCAGKTGVTVLGRWSVLEWEDYEEAISGRGASAGSDNLSP